MALVGKTDGYAVYVKQFEWKKIWIEPNMSSNGTWMADGYSCRGTGLDSLSNLYKVFNGTYTSYLNKFNVDTWIEICLPQPTEVAGCYMTSSDGYFPATGDIYYSDDGETYTKCGSWTDSSTSKNVTAYVTRGSGAHRIWRFKATSKSSAHPNSNSDVSVAKLFTEVKEYLSVDNTLPQGMGGRVNVFAVKPLHEGLDIRKLHVFYTYKQDDKVNLWEGSDNNIKGITSAEVTYRPHNGLDVHKQTPIVTYRMNEGIDVRKATPFVMQRWEDKVDTFTIPYGIGGIVHPFITMRLNTLVGYINNMNATAVGHIALENNAFTLKAIQSINDIPFDNNNTADNKGG